jgi:hypothetical protein
VEAGSNTSTVLLLRVVGGDEKGTQWLGYDRVTLFGGGGNINTGIWPSRLAESRI